MKKGLTQPALDKDRLSIIMPKNKEYLTFKVYLLYIQLGEELN